MTLPEAESIFGTLFSAETRGVGQDCGLENPGSIRKRFIRCEPCWEFYIIPGNYSVAEKREGHKGGTIKFLSRLCNRVKILEPQTL